MNAMEIVAYVLISIYSVSLIAITLYCLIQFHLLYFYKQGVEHQKSPSKASNDLPKVTIQLPIYNEKFVVQRLINAICAIDYPLNKLEVQVLDDSTDETKEIIQAEVTKQLAKGVDIKHIRRANREGFKAGALKNATLQATGEFIAIFDADFVPKSDFLRQTMAHFDDPKIGVVQTRWDHLNQDQTLLTRVQAFQLNVHFSVEQRGRYEGDLFLQFNGTAGIWRKKAIEHAGGWEADTLTEDLDLSYRAQLKGWKIKYLEDIVSPAELPSQINGLKSQQYRWMKGGAETAKKVLPTIWRSQLSLKRKIHASSHLLGSSIFLAVFTLGIVSVPLALIVKPLGLPLNVFSLFILSLLTVATVYFVANVQMAWRQEHLMTRIVKFIFLFPLFLALSMGLSLHNAVAVIHGYRGKKTDFVRTPKFASLTTPTNLLNYSNQGSLRLLALEGLLSLYFAIAFVYSIHTDNYSFTILHLMLAFGYGFIFIFSFNHGNK